MCRKLSCLIYFVLVLFLVGTSAAQNIDLQTFADQGVNLANVNTIALGLGNRNNPVAGGSGTMYFDDIRLYSPPPKEPQAP